MRFDPVEQCRRRCEMKHHERVKEAIYAWMDEEAGTAAEHVAWEHFRRACKAWVNNGHG